MAHAQKPDLVFQRNGRVHLNRRGCQFRWLLAAEECGSADSDCIDRVPTYRARLLATHSIRIFPIHFQSRASPCAIRFLTRCRIGIWPKPLRPDWQWLFFGGYSGNQNISFWLRLLCVLGRYNLVSSHLWTITYLNKFVDEIFIVYFFF